MLAAKPSFMPEKAGMRVTRYTFVRVRIRSEKTVFVCEKHDVRIFFKMTPRGKTSIYIYIVVINSVEIPS